jgi:hypothetical protein
VAQPFKLSGLRLSADVAAGSWVAYQIDMVSKKSPTRRITQRIAVVARDGAGAESGAWVEMKTTESGKTRIERGYFMAPESRRDALDSLFSDDPPPAPAGGDPLAPPKATTKKLRLARYQKLMPDGKLYEYPMEDETSAIPEEDLSAMGMFDFAGRGIRDSLPPDTLRVGRKVVPCRVRRVRRLGAQEWAGEDSSYVNRPQIVETYWRNAYIPVTGIAREVAEISSVRVPVGAAAPPDSTTTPSGAAPSPNSEFFYSANITLTDLGNNAIPEITQAPEPAPHESISKPRLLER